MARNDYLSLKTSQTGLFFFVLVFNKRKKFKPSYASCCCACSCYVVSMLLLFLSFGVVNFCYYQSKINFQFVRVKQCDCEAFYRVSNGDSSSISDIFFSREGMVSFVRFFLLHVQFSPFFF
jgi:hypothetical protein